MCQISKCFMFLVTKDDMNVAQRLALSACCFLLQNPQDGLLRNLSRHSWFPADRSLWSPDFFFIATMTWFLSKIPQQLITSPTMIFGTNYSSFQCVTLNHVKPFWRCVQDFCLWPWTCKSTDIPISLSCAQNFSNVSMSHLKREGEQVNVTYLQNVCIIVVSMLVRWL